MNEVLQNIMNFINENTLLLIGICVFLILVLVGYLIDNSVKSKRIRKDIKNKDQVPASIKEEIIKEAEEKRELNKTPSVVENISIQNTNREENNVAPSVSVEPTKEEVTLDLNNQNNVVNNNVEVQNDALDSALNLNVSNSVEPKNEALDNVLNLDSSLNLENTNTNVNNFNMETPVFDANINVNDNINLTNNQTDTLDLGLDLNTASNNVTPTIDPDAFIMGSVNPSYSEFKNDKSLSEILLANNSLNIVETNNTNATPLNIEMNNDVNNSSNDELDQIMQKLSSLKTDTEEDNYTNIF